MKVHLYMFFKYISEAFKNDIDDPYFQKWLSSSLGLIYSRFIHQHNFWKEKEYIETRGRKGLSDELRQEIYDEWKINSIFSPVHRDGRDTVKMRTLHHLKEYK